MDDFEQFPLDLQTLLSLLRMNRVTGRVVAAISGREGMPQQFERQVVLDIVDGQLSNCMFVSAKGALLAQGRHLLPDVQRLGELQWHLVLRPVAALPPPRAEAPPSPPLRITDRIPRKVRNISVVQMAAWPRRKRQVFLLIDGRRRGYEIARQLEMQVADVAQLLEELYYEQFIVLGPE